MKIDTTKKPQFPIDEPYYLDKPIEAVDFVTSCYKKNNANAPEIQFPDESKDPVFFIDSIRVNKGVLQTYNPNEIALVTVYKDANAIKIFGPEAKYGLIYIETKSFTKDRYQTYFKSKSLEYVKLVSSSGDDSDIQYILNGKVLKENFEGDLSSIDNKSFTSIKIIDKAQLAKEYGILNKKHGVVILTTKPANLK